MLTYVYQVSNGSKQTYLCYSDSIVNVLKWFVIVDVEMSNCKPVIAVQLKNSVDEKYLIVELYQLLVHFFSTELYLNFLPTET